MVVVPFCGRAMAGGCTRFRFSLPIMHAAAEFLPLREARKKGHRTGRPEGAGDFRLRVLLSAAPAWLERIEGHLARSSTAALGADPARHFALLLFAQFALGLRVRIL